MLPGFLVVSFIPLVSDDFLDVFLLLVCLVRFGGVFFGGSFGGERPIGHRGRLVHVAVVCLSSRRL